MKIISCHNYYQQPGGEDRSFEDEVCMLEAHGHEVVRYTRHNDDLDGMGKISAARRTIWNKETYSDLSALIRKTRPDLMHCTNTFPLISPAAYYAARAEGVPVVQALRNYRLMCPGALLMRDNRVCESCFGKTIPWPAIRHRCYRGSRAASTVVAAMLGVHNIRGTWTKAVNRFYTLTDFARNKFIEAGLPAERIDVKPNFVDPDPKPGDGKGGYAVFVGRLSPEKGVSTLIEAWSMLESKLPLKIVGDGPMFDELKKQCGTESNIELLGRKSADEMLQIVGDASFLVMPSVWYETFGRVIIESYAVGTPVLVSNMGAMRELVVDGVTGLLFQPGDARDLANKADQMFAKRECLHAMRHAARRIYEEKYTAAENYEHLMAIYAKALNGLPMSLSTDNESSIEAADAKAICEDASVSDSVAAASVSLTR
jgi:glycosyltransferase involved in cell wall biosynthesis